MAQVTISDVILGPGSAFPSGTSGILTFVPSDFFIDSAGKIRARNATMATVNSEDGTFSIDLESTTDSNPSSVVYYVTLEAKIGSVRTVTKLGRFSLPPSPSSQSLSDLLLAGIIDEAAIGTPVFGEVPDGDINSDNVDFTLENTPILGTVRVYLQGIRQAEGVGYDISGKNLTMLIVPLEDQALVVDYIIG